MQRGRRHRDRHSSHEPAYGDPRQHQLPHRSVDRRPLSLPTLAHNLEGSKPQLQTNCTASPPSWPKSAWSVSPLRANTTRVNDPARIRCPGSSVTPCWPSLLASQATPRAGWPSTPAATPVSSISELRYM